MASSKEEIETENFTFKVEIFLDDEQKLVRLNVFNNNIGGYSHWSFHKADLRYVQQIEFMTEIITTRLYAYICDILYCETPREILETKLKIKSLALTLESLEIPDHYDYDKTEIHLQKASYYENQPFQVNYSPCNDLKHFASSIASNIIALMGMETESLEEFETFYSKYQELIVTLKESLKDMFIFGIVEHHIERFDPKKAYRSVYSLIRDGIESAKHSIYIVDENVESLTMCKHTPYPKYKKACETRK